MAQDWISPVFLVCFIALLSAHQTQSEFQNADPKVIKKVHVIFMNHLDVGYDGLHPTVGFALNVINRYFTQYYPRAVSIAEALRVFGYRERFIYTTHPWLLYWYLHCSPVTLVSNVTLQCPNKTDVDAMRVSISMGDVVWHAGPMNMQYELMHPLLFDFSLDISSFLDQEFNITRTTPVVSQRDVPGMTKAVIPIMKKHGIAAISVGVNDMTSPPAVPRNPFIWKMNPQDRDDEGIIAFWHPGGYPDNAGVYPSAPGGLSASDCLFAQDVTAFPEVLCFAFRTDNSGPPETVAEVINDFEVARGQFPNAFVVASTLDQYVSSLKASSTSYPTVTQEIGDTWIMGVQSDPWKIAIYRVFAKVLAGCFQNGECSIQDPRMVQAVHFLTKIPEHTWGLDSVNDFQNWTNQAFEKARRGKNFTDCETSWIEQRQFLQLAYESLGHHPITKALVNSVEELTAQVPDLSDYSPVASASQQICSSGLVLQFASDGSLIRLHDPVTNLDWASAQNPLGQLLYSTYNETDYDYMSKLYDYFGNGGAGFHKVNSTPNAHPESRTWPFSLQTLYRRKGAENCDFIVKIVPSDQTSVTKYGAPPLFYVQYVSTTKTGLDIVVQWFNKGPTRLAEAISFGFTPIAYDGVKWSLFKLGQIIDPMNVILNGSQYLHAVDKGVTYSRQNGSGLQILSTDVALVTLGTTSHPVSVFPVPLLPLVEPIRTVAYNLYNNLWTTNYIYWYPYFQQDQNLKARFSVKFL